MPDSSDAWDVIVLGGALSGAATALQLLRRRPGTRVLIVERSECFGRRVGESTVEVSAWFLGRHLGLTEHLNRHHLVKQGLRFWFTNPDVASLGECSETGPGYNVRFPGYQVDRAVLDQEVLRLAVEAGARLARPATVHEVRLAPGGRQTVVWSGSDGTRRSHTARWVVDATGIASVVARREGWLETNTDHPIATCWTRWRGIRSWDDPELHREFPGYGSRTKAVRFTATNHVVGNGWWSWWIPLRDGDVSVGIVYDQRLIELEPGEHLGTRLRTFLERHPAAKTMLADATWVPGDVHFRRNCAYRSKRIAGDGFVLVGDAAGFIDPFYSPGMDWISFSTGAAASLLDGCLRGRPAAERAAAHDARFRECYERWFDAVYRDKYEYMGDQELMTLAFRLDLGLYYLGVVKRPLMQGAPALEHPPFAGRAGGFAAKLLALYNRRFVAMARSRRKRGTWGRTNRGRYTGFRSYELDWHLPRRVAGCLLHWGWLEAREGWRTWGRTKQ